MDKTENKGEGWVHRRGDNQMKIEIDEKRFMIIKEVYQGFIMETQEGNRIAICMRDDTFEINIMPKGVHTGNWHRIDMQTGTIEKERIAVKLRIDTEGHDG